MTFFLLQKHTSHTPGESRDLEMSEEEISEVGFFALYMLYVFMLIINTIVLKQNTHSLIFDSAVIANCVCHLQAYPIFVIQDPYTKYIVPLIASLR